MSASNHNNPSHGPKRLHRLMTAGLASIIAAGLLSSTAVESGDTLSAIDRQFGGDRHDYTGYHSGNPDLIRWQAGHGSEA